MANYFDNFPVISYDVGVDGKSEFQLLTDITRNVRVRTALMKNIISYDSYFLRDGETPEETSLTLYGTPNYYWIIMLVNERFDRVYDFVMTPATLNNYVNNKYGDQADAVVYYIDSETGVKVISEGATVAGTSSGLVPVTNRKHEETRNEANRLINFPASNVITDILRQFRDLI